MKICSTALIWLSKSKNNSVFWPGVQISFFIAALSLTRHHASRKVNPLWNVSASDARQQASVCACAHDSVVFYVVYFIMLSGKDGKIHNKSVRRQREREALLSIFDVQHVILFKLCLTQALLPACCRTTGFGLHWSLVCLEQPLLLERVEKFCFVPSQG